MNSLRLDKFRVIASERKRITERIKELQPEISNRQIARTLGVGSKTVDRDLASDDAAARDNSGEINAPASGGASNDADTSRKANETNTPPSGRGESSPPALTGREAALTLERREHNRVTPNSGEQLWFTPAEYITAARNVMGGIDLDPASHPLAQETIQATLWYGPEQDGLAQPWHGRVWLNPPYSHPLIEQFIAKLLEEYRSGTVSEAIMVTNNCTETAWFHRAEAEAALLCFPRGRIPFYGHGDIGNSPLQGQTFFYYGQNDTAFRAVFEQWGFVRRR
jgi:ParB family chromosome partitioning protein